MTDRIADAPPSAKLVYKILEYHGSLTQKEIVTESRLPNRTVRDALENLQDRNIVSRDVYIPDARQNIYRITGDICSNKTM